MYQQGYYNNVQSPYGQPMQYQIQSNITYVQGEVGARSYLVAPNTRMALWDSEQYLNPVPIPAYMVQNPNCCQQTCGCGCGM